MRSSIRLTSLYVCLLLAPAAVLAADWPHARGPNGDGSAAPVDLLERDDVGLELAWRVPAGSGYSGVAVAGDLAVTMFTSGDSDVLAAFDTGDGKVKWSRELDAAYHGHDGSDDGPLSNPVIGDGVVYALVPRGKLIAVRLADGRELWTRKLADDLGAEPPDFGFGTSPVVADGVVVVLAGGSDSKTVCGFDGRSGERRWCTGGDEVRYQSPAAMTLGGQRQVVVAKVPVREANVNTSNVSPICGCRPDG